MRLILFLLLTALARAGSFSGNVVGISDGDTITVLKGGREQVKIRIYGIDAPEEKQAFGERSKQELARLIFKKTIRYDEVDVDRYGRTIARVYIGDMDAGTEMVMRGFAWWYREYAPKESVLRSAEAEARTARRGLWRDKDPTPPWGFRATTRNGPVRR